MYPTITFKIMSNERDYQVQLARELCNWDNFNGSLLDQSTQFLETPLYYFDSNNTKQTIMDPTSFATMVLDSGNSENDVIHLYSDNNTDGAANTTASDWVFAPEDETTDGKKRSTQSNNGTSFVHLYSTCFIQLGQIIEKHKDLIESNPHLHMLTRRFAFAIASTPDAKMISRFDEWLTSYNNNNNNNNNSSSNEKSTSTSDTKEYGKRHKSRHCGGRRGKENVKQCDGRRELVSSLPDDLAQFLLANRHGRHHRHHHHHHPWMDQNYTSQPGFLTSLWTGGIHKHKHHHHHRHCHDEQPPYYPSHFGTTGAFDPATTGPWSAHPFFGGRHGKFSMMCSRSDRHFEKAMKHHHRHHRRHPYFDSPSSSSDSTSSSSSSSSSNSENENNDGSNVEHKKSGSKREQKKLWKAMAKEQLRRGRSHHGILGHEGFYGYGRHNAPMSFFTGHPHHGGQVPPPPPPPGYIEQSFGQMNINDSKNQ